MLPWEKCGARGQVPCRTAAGSIARATHAVRIVDEVGELERLTIEAVALAKWIKVTDKPKVEDVLVAAREVDRVVRKKAEPARNFHRAAGPASSKIIPSLRVA